MHGEIKTGLHRSNEPTHINSPKQRMNRSTRKAKVDFIIDNVVVWGGNPPTPAPGWLAIQDGKIDAIGGIDQMPPPAGKVINGSSKNVLPSFVDCHTHLSASALANLARNGGHCKSKHEALALVEQAAKEDASSGWIVCFYMDWDAWEHPVPPTALELEEASAGRKVFLICDSLHRGVLSESGLRACNIVKTSPDPFVEKKWGQINGTVWETTFSRCLQIALDAIVETLGEDGLEDALMAEVQRHLSYGITAAHDPGVNKHLSAVMSRINARTPMSISWSEVGRNGPLNSAGGSKALDEFGDGPPSAKVFTDGAHRCSMCLDAADTFRIAMGSFASALKTFSPVPIQQLLVGKTELRGGKIYRNGDMFTPAELTNRLAELDENFDRIKIHALGNGAVDMACDCMIESGVTTKVCIEHATFIDRGNIEKLARHDAQVSLQSGFLSHYGDFFLQMKMTGKVRGLAARSILDAGVDLILSSDSPCGPLDPLHNLRCAVSRQLPDGRIYLEDEAIAPSEAVHAYTIAGQKGINGEDKQGLEVGAPADFVVLTGDPFTESTAVESTWIAGAQVYSR